MEKPPRPHWPIERVQGLVAAGQVFIHRGRALVFFGSKVEAYAAVAATVATLTEQSFAHTKQQADLCDVYGILRESGGWYLKITITGSPAEVAVVSFHPLEHPIRTLGGVVKP